MANELLCMMQNISGNKSYEKGETGGQFSFQIQAEDVCFQLQVLSYPGSKEDVTGILLSIVPSDNLVHLILY